ncbi:uncharacterized protein STEHIDRAFT_155079 [Stereum hirsutum FP-91666 SS1]|uniref:uncharacterized protein n=1 Tax=Stereum hirsutum (strain FP-91666) TaxID=721885 RepID=UPI000440B9A3|nr:uncharacterized protein STEHIDRAFT_155079 [Stereum hirsutum FP-91666 SS1]EIM89417.1 hypothetical protein STEHIDRAFT_155079 [Stereum hirsutum FP-91666 SS1]
MLSLFGISVIAILTGIAAAESHKVTLRNNCGSGNAVFLYQGHPTPQGSTTIQGQLLGGIAWVSGLSGHNCENSGVNCGAVEFTLVNPNSGPNTQNAADFTLEAQPENGNHQFTYKMAFNFEGCSGSATCNSPSDCPGAFTNPTNGHPVQCTASNVGIDITFC